MVRDTLRLFTFWRSSAAYRVRIALHLKRLTFEAVPKRFAAREHRQPDYLDLNPQGLLPALQTSHGVLAQSLAIIEYLDERYPEPPLLPASLEQRARARQLAQIVCTDVQPLNGFRVHVYLRDVLGVDAGRRRRWFEHWLLEGLDAIELWLTADAGSRRFAVGDTVSIADVCLVPQLDLARRNRIDVEEFPRLAALERACMALPAFRDTHPDTGAA